MERKLKHIQEWINGKDKENTKTLIKKDQCLNNIQSKDNMKEQDIVFYMIK